MSINLLEAVQHNLGYPALKKIDPNTQQVSNNKATSEDRFSQAAIPAVLTGLYRYVQSDEGAAAFLRSEYSTNWVADIFEDEGKEVMQKIADYSQHPIEGMAAKMNEIANETMRLARKSMPAIPAMKDVKHFFANQRNHILLYLPAALHMGDLLHDDTLDDNTHKMQGPVSSLMQSIASAFTNPVVDEEVKKHQMNF